jgi:N-acetylmuramoyl-L-alanine amidase
MKSHQSGAVRSGEKASSGRRALIKRFTVSTVAFKAAAGFALGSAPASADEVYGPTGTSNGYSIYLSPSSQTSNVGCNGYNEADGAWLAAVRAKDSLVSRGYKVIIGTGTVSQRIASSNSLNVDAHIPMHSNATTNADCTNPRPASSYGTIGFHASGSSVGSILAGELADAIGTYSPGTHDYKTTQSFDELTQTSAPAGYLEAEYHTWVSGTNWLGTSYKNTYAGRVGLAVDRTFGYP